MKTFVDQYAQRDDGKIGIVEVRNMYFSDIVFINELHFIKLNSNMIWQDSFGESYFCLSNRLHSVYKHKIKNCWEIKGIQEFAESSRSVA